MTAVWWIRRDVRLEANSALEAARTDGPVVALYVRDLTFPQRTRRSGFLEREVSEIHLRTAGVVVRRGSVDHEVLAVARAAGARRVYIARDHGPYGRQRDAQVAQLLRDHGIELVEVGGPYAVAPGTIVNADGNPCRTFRSFNTRWNTRLDMTGDDTADADGIEWLFDPAWSNDHLDPSDDTGQRHGTLDAFLPKLAQYPTERDHIAEDGTSRLSSSIRFGIIHPNQLITAVSGRDGSVKFIEELCWREWYAELLHRDPTSAWQEGTRRDYSSLWDRDAGARRRFDLWTAGETGFTLVDAGIRELLATGFMHNRVRMVVASFLVKHLHVPWQWGAAFFMRHLVDGDLASNNLSWQWVAGVGVDAAPWYRIMSPLAQGERFDPEGEYVRRWIGELEDASAGLLHTPGAGGMWKPAIVDLATERAEALRRWKALRD